MLRMGNIQAGRLDWGDLTYVDLDGKTLAEYAIRPGDLMFNRTNSAELVGKSAIVKEDREAVFASYLVRFRVRGEIADPDYICQIINGPLGRAYISKHMGRAIGQVNISAGKMHEFPVPYPPIAEQRRIMNAVAEIDWLTDEVAQNTSSQLSAIEALPAALLAVAFRGEF